MKRKIIYSFVLFILVMFINISDVYGTEIYVKLINGQNITLEVESSDTIESVKGKIRDKENIEIGSQRLIFSGIEMENGRTLGDYDVRKHDTIYLIPKINYSKLKVNGKYVKVEIDGKVVNEINIKQNTSYNLVITPDEGYMVTDMNVSNGVISKNDDGTYTLDKVNEDNVILNIETIPVGIKSIEKTKTEGLIDFYKITFTDGKEFTFQIKNGEDGKDGINGKNGKTGNNGKPGKDGKTGKDGKDGIDGVTPNLRFNPSKNELEVSYDNEVTWKSLGAIQIGNIENNDNSDNVQDNKKEYGLKEYLVVGLIGIMALTGNIGWIIALKK